VYCEIRREYWYWAIFENRNLKFIPISLEIQSLNIEKISMPSLSVLIIFIISSGGMLFMIIRKWPELRAIEILSLNTEQKSFKERARERMAGLNSISNLHTEKLLKKVLVKAKILFMKGERRADHYLRRVSHSEKFKDDYWGKMNKS